MFKFFSKIQSAIYNIQSTSSGFTLIEILVVFSLMSIVAGVGFASFVSYSRSQTLTQSASDIKGTVDKARFNAISSVKPPAQAGCGETDSLNSYTFNFCVNFNPSCTGSEFVNGRSYQIHVTCGSQTPLLVLSKTLPANVSFLSPDSGNQCQDVVFTSVSSAVAGGNCGIKVGGYGNAVNVSIDAGGYVSFN